MWGTKLVSRRWCYIAASGSQPHHGCKIECTTFGIRSSNRPPISISRLLNCMRSAGSPVHMRLGYCSYQLLCSCSSNPRVSLLSGHSCFPSQCLTICQLSRSRRPLNLLESALLSTLSVTCVHVPAEDDFA